MSSLTISESSSECLKARLSLSLYLTGCSFTFFCSACSVWVPILEELSWKDGLFIFLFLNLLVASLLSIPTGPLAISVTSLFFIPFIFFAKAEGEDTTFSFRVWKCCSLSVLMMLIVRWWLSLSGLLFRKDLSKSGGPSSVLRLRLFTGHAGCFPALLLCFLLLTNSEFVVGPKYVDACRSSRLSCFTLFRSWRGELSVGSK